MKKIARKTRKTRTATTAGMRMTTWFGFTAYPPTHGVPFSDVIRSENFRIAKSRAAGERVGLRACRRLAASVAGGLTVVAVVAEELALRVRAAPHIRQEIKNLVAGELVEQALRHDRGRYLLLVRDVRALDLQRLRARQRVLNQLHDAVL